MSEDKDKVLKSLIKELEKKIKTVPSESSLLLKLGGYITLLFTAHFALTAWLFDYRLDFTNEENNSRFERLEAAVFSPSYEVLLNEIRSLKNNNNIYPVVNTAPKKKLDVKSKKR